MVTVMKNALTQSIKLNNGIQMPFLGLGVWRTNEGEEVINSVKWAIEAGYRSIDTAKLYGNEEGVGKAVRESGLPAEDIFITTKVWNDDHGYEKTLKAFAESKKRLGLDIDLYLVHWPYGDTYRETWKALVHLFKEGYVKAIGVSNFEQWQIDEIIEDTGVIPAVNQVELHPLLSQKELLSYSNNKGIKLTAWRPIMLGMLDNPLLNALSKKYGKTAAQIVLRWHIQNGVVVIPKSIHKERIIENSLIFDFELSNEDVSKIDGLNQNLHLTR